MEEVMAGPLVDEASPCPQCGGRRLLLTFYTSAAYDQEIEIREDSSVVALHEEVKAYEEPTGDISFCCLQCGYSWE